MFSSLDVKANFARSTKGAPQRVYQHFGITQPVEEKRTVGCWDTDGHVLHAAVFIFHGMRPRDGADQRGDQ
jgi:hypothetical protein